MRLIQESLMSNTYPKLICFLYVLPHLCYGPVMRQKRAALINYSDPEIVQIWVSEIWEQKLKPETRTTPGYEFYFWARRAFVVSFGLKYLPPVMNNVTFALIVFYPWFIEKFEYHQHLHRWPCPHNADYSGVWGACFLIFWFSDLLLLEARVPLINLQVSASSPSLLLTLFWFRYVF